MIRTHLEVERKYDAAASWSLPDLHDLPGVTAIDPSEGFTLRAVYLDTADLVLAANAITLRRRTGGDDEGWHLKLPRGERGRAARLEVGVPLTATDADVPPALVDRIAGYLRGRPLVPVAAITTRRTVRLLRGTDGRALAEVADDLVSAVALPRTHGAVERTSAWREIEVELVDGTDALLDATGDRLLAAGATAATVGSKLARTIGPDAAPRAGPTVRPAKRSSDAGTVLVAYLAKHASALRSHDPEVRQAEVADEPSEPVHQMRVATRRLRSALVSFRPLLDPARTDPVRDELGDLGSLLGAVRDTQVLRSGLLGTLDRLPADLVTGPVRSRIDDELRAREARAQGALRSALERPGYYALLDALDSFTSTAPVDRRARHAARSQLPPRVGREWDRLARAHGAVGEAGSPGQRDAALHEERKAAKRVRYAAELLEPVAGRDAARLARRAAAIQTALGDHQDTVVARAFLLVLASRARLAGEDGFTYGVLHGLEQQKAAAAVHRHAEAWEAAARGSVRRWTR